MGHPLGYTGTDIFSRYKRLKGYNVLHPMGFDAFGLPAEQHAINTGEHPAKITKENCQRFVEQLKTLGLSYDWDREVATCDPSYYHWTQWIFLQLYNSWFDEEKQCAKPIATLPIPEDIRSKGEAAILEYQSRYRLAYYDSALVNWCPALGTVLANEEVIDGKSERGGHDVIRKPMKQWLLRITKYAERLLSELEEIDWPESIKEQQRNWIGKRVGAEIDFKTETGKTLTAFTTRPDTLFGVTFFVISPEHPLALELTTEGQKKAVEEYRDEAAKLSDLARTMDNRKKTGVATGTFVVNPINGEKVPLFVGDYVLMSYGTGAVMGVPAHDERDFEFAKLFSLSIRPVIAPADSSVEDYEKICAGEACYTAAGIMLPNEEASKQGLTLDGIPNAEAKKAIASWLEQNQLGRSVTNYRLRDWLFSRQRYWGEPIPIIHWEDGTTTAVSEEELPLVLPEVEDYKPSDGGESPLAKATGWLKVTCPQTGKSGRRETNTMPQWAGSCWYYLRFIDPHNDQAGWDRDLEKAWMPVDLYVGGAEHAVLHLLYARFWHKVLFDLGHVSTREPFGRLFNQGMLVSFAYKDSRGALIPVDEVTENEDGSAVHDKTGDTVERITAKMSKSLRNVINPDEVIEQYGADTLRLYLMFMGPLENIKTWDSQAISGVHRFLKKTWSLFQEALGTEVAPSKSDESKDIQKAIALAIKRVGESLENLRFNTAISSLMECLNTLDAKGVSKETLSSFTILLSPLAPHLAEELWSLLGNSQSVGQAQWPAYREEILVDSSVNLVIQVNGKKRALIEVEKTITEENLKELAVSELAGTAYEITSSDKFIVVRDKKSGSPKLLNIIVK